MVGPTNLGINIFIKVAKKKVLLYNILSRKYNFTCHVENCCKSARQFQIRRDMCKNALLGLIISPCTFDGRPPHHGNLETGWYEHLSCKHAPTFTTHQQMNNPEDTSHRLVLRDQICTFAKIRYTAEGDVNAMTLCQS